MITVSAISIGYSTLVVDGREGAAFDSEAGSNNPITSCADIVISGNFLLGAVAFPFPA